MDTTQIDLADRATFARGIPHDLFERLRQENPVFWHAATPGVVEQVGEGFWVMTRHDHARLIMRDLDSFTSIDSPRIQRMTEWRGMTIVSMDPPDHTRLRSLISRGFTPRSVGRLEAMMRTRAATAFDKALAAGGCDFVEDIAFPIPMHVMGDIIGIPESDRAYVFGLVDRFLKEGDPEEGVTSDDTFAIHLELFGYASELGARKRAEPTDDIWSVLIEARMTDGDGVETALSQTELDLFFIILGVAGIDTTRNALSWGLQALLEHPAELERARQDLSLLPAAVEEIVRWTSPIPFWCRGAKVDVEVDGQLIRAGDRVSAWLVSANRDAAVFDDPFRLDLARDPNPHVGFGGGGPHFCLGANLARLEMTAVLEQLLTRVHSVDWAGPPLDGQIDLRNNIMRYAKSLPIMMSGR